MHQNQHQHQHQHQNPDHHPPDVAWITAQSKAHWDRSSTSYAEVLIRRGLTEPNFRQVIDAVVKYCKPDGRIRVLDLASNAGSPAVPLGKAIPNASVVATDLSPASVSLISEYAASEGVTNVTAQPADAQHLQEFDDNTFDAVTCSYGLMFMPDHQKALQEAHRVLKSGGLYVATVWGPLEHYQFGQMFSEVARRIAGDPGPPPSPYTPWRFSNPLQLLQDLKGAHFSNAHCTAYSHPMTFPFADLVAFQLGPNGQSRPLLDSLKATGKENIYEEAPQVMRAVLREQGLLHGETAHFENTALMFTAVK
ncbi:TPA: hypothetical protein ACH3X1_011519 [Trebouxia sp. C0004]